MHFWTHYLHTHTLENLTQKQKWEAACLLPPGSLVIVLMVLEQVSEPTLPKKCKQELVRSRNLHSVFTRVFVCNSTRDQFIPMGMLVTSNRCTPSIFTFARDFQRGWKKNMSTSPWNWNGKIPSRLLQKPNHTPLHLLISDNIYS